jgi:hypothetical protein
MGNTLLWEKGSVKMESVEEVKRKSKGKESRFRKRYGFELKLRCVKLRLEEGRRRLWMWGKNVLKSSPTPDADRRKHDQLMLSRREYFWK